MQIEKIYAVYFSAAGHTAKVVNSIASQIASEMQKKWETADFTLPQSREVTYSFGPKDLVIFGTPTYAGKVPNKVLPFVQTLFHGENTPFVPVVTFGNRSYDNALAELKYELEQSGFFAVAAGAFACSHVFSDKIAAGRPDSRDMALLHDFAEKICDRIRTEDAETLQEYDLQVRGQHDAPYYIPKGIDGKPAKFLKAKPKTDPEKCDRCGICVKVCPMGSISPENVAEVPGICIKCQACIRKCPQHAKYLDDPAFLSHVQMLEHNYIRRAEPEVFL